MPERKNVRKKNALRSVARQSISPLQRYRMIAEMAYYRALERGFVGGNPVEDWLEAEKAIDEKYALDLSNLLVTPHIAGVFELLNRLLGAYGVTPIDVKTLMEKECRNVEALAYANTHVREPIKTAVSRQIEILTDALEAMLARFELLAQVDRSREPFAAEQGKLLKTLGERTLANLRESTDATMQASVESLDTIKVRVLASLGVLKSLAEGIVEHSSPAQERSLPTASKSLGVERVLAPGYAGRPFRELANAPVSALRGLSESHEQVLKDEFGIKTLKGFAENKHFNWALQIVTLAELETAERWRA